MGSGNRGALATPVRRIYANLGKLLGGKAGAGVASLLYLLVAVRGLGARDYGVLVLVYGFMMTVGALIEFPGWHAVVRYGAIAAAERDDSRLGRLLRFVGGVELAGGSLAVLVAALLAHVLGPRLGWSPAVVGYLQTLVEHFLDERDQLVLRAPEAACEPYRPITAPFRSGTEAGSRFLGILADLERLFAQDAAVTRAIRSVRMSLPPSTTIVAAAVPCR